MKKGKVPVIVVSSDDRSGSIELQKMIRLASEAIAPIFDYFQPDAQEFHAGVFDGASAGMTHNQRACIASGRIMLEETVGRIKTVAVDKALRGANLGSIIVSALEGVASERGISDLVVVEPLPGAVGFFEALGYTPQYSSSGNRVDRMTKTLDASAVPLHAVKLSGQST